ncbi:hypothetical protein NPIL_208042 [Nephila pilipes]|uniref:Uncharacterized protein n=1 Tax=Nephila pilipes TaxID=299642 RepID=A0A8X6N0M5_NEPPI|nr:hypothetical protein NPIL_208042 [Nephila pilipes]
MWTLLCLLATGAALVQSMSRTERASVKALYTKYIVFPKCCNNNDGHCTCTEQSTKKPGSSTEQTTKKPG